MKTTHTVTNVFVLLAYTSTLMMAIAKRVVLSATLTFTLTIASLSSDTMTDKHSKTNLPEVSKMTIESIRFAYDRGFFTCENDVFQLPLSTYDKLIYILLVRYADTNNRAWPSYERLAKEASCSRRKAIQSIQHLESVSLIKKEIRHNKSNVYLIYPARFYKDNSDSFSSPVGVQEIHQRGEPPAPPEVNNIHPGSESPAPNNKHLQTPNNINNHHLDDDEFFFKKLKSFLLSKNLTFPEKFIQNLHKKFSFQEIYSALSSIDYDRASNIPHLLTYLLNTGSYNIRKKPLQNKKTLDFDTKELPNESEKKSLIANIRSSLPFLSYKHT